ncbi:MAG: dTDP-4-dehydrorhamnose 3,5-epimerase [Bacillota bacterium]|nr:dTDP-4-dehydrorhamnose 3,5-epimerase [Bacillota bacterium]
MGHFSIIKGTIKGLYVIEPKVFEDERGYFMETYSVRDFESHGIKMEFVQDNQSKSQRGVLRGLHFQKNYPQAKLVRVLRGEIFDVAVDVRKNSPTFGKWQGVYLSEWNRKQFLISEGFAHGFLTLSDEAEVLYKCNEYYHPEDDEGVIWNDIAIAIDWPLDKVREVILSEKDGKLPKLKDALVF